MTTENAVIKNALNAGSKVLKTDDNTLEAFIATQVQSLFLLAGQEPGKKDVQLIIREILRELKTRYKSLTLKEIEYCFSCGVREEYGEYFGINVVSISKWLRTYYNSEERREAQMQNLFPRLPAKTKPTPAELTEMRKKALAKRWREFCETGSCYDLGNVVYNFLNSKGLISFTADEKRDMMEWAKKELAKEAKDREPAVKVGSVIDNITEGNVVYRAKVIALNTFFERLKNEGKNVNLLIAE